MTDEGPTDAQILQVLAFAGPDACIDVDGIDQGDLLTYAKHELSAPQAAPVEAHLEACEYCRLLLDEYRADLGLAPNVVPIVSKRGSPWRLVAAAVACFATVGLASSLDRIVPGAYELSNVEGLVAETRAAPSEATAHWRISPGSKLRITLRPSGAMALGADATAGVFVQTSAGTYRRATSQVEVVPSDGAPSFRIEVTGQTLLSGRGTGRDVVLVVVESSAALDDLEGRVAFEVGQRGVMAVVHRSLDVVW